MCLVSLNGSVTTRCVMSGSLLFSGVGDRTQDPGRSKGCPPLSYIPSWSSLFFWWWQVSTIIAEIHEFTGVEECCYSNCTISLNICSWLHLIKAFFLPLTVWLSVVQEIRENKVWCFSFLVFNIMYWFFHTLSFSKDHQFIKKKINVISWIKTCLVSFPSYIYIKFFLKTGSHFLAQAGFEYVSLLFQPSWTRVTGVWHHAWYSYHLQSTNCPAFC